MKSCASQLDPTSARTDKRLQAESSTWSPADWERYLSSFESEPEEVLFARSEDVESVSGADYFKAMSALTERADHLRFAEMIEDVMRELSARQREIIRLRYWEDLSFQEIADRLGVSTGTVDTYLRRSHEKLRALLQKGSHTSVAKIFFQRRISEKEQGFDAI